MWVVKPRRESGKNYPNWSLFTTGYERKKPNPILSILRLIFEGNAKYSLM